MRYFRILFVFTSYLAAFTLAGQSSAQQKVKIGPDTNHIRKYPDYLRLGLFTEAPIMEIRLIPTRDSSAKYTNDYKGNFTSSVGFTFGYRNVNIAAGFQTSPNPNSTAVKGQSSYRNFRIKVRWKAIYAAAFSTKYTGFYDQNTAQNFGKLSDSTKAFLIRPDISFRQRMASVTGNLSWRKYSYFGPHTFSERQIRSRIGILVRGTVGHLRITGDSALVHGTQGAFFRGFNRIETLRAVMFKGGPGLGFNIVIFKRFYLAAAWFVQANTVFYRSKSEDGFESPTRVSIATFSEGNIGLGFNSKRFFAGFFVTGVSNRIKFHDARLETSTGALTLDIGYRFNCPKTFKKFWDKTFSRHLKL